MSRSVPPEQIVQCFRSLTGAFESGSQSFSIRYFAKTPCELLSIFLGYFSHEVYGGNYILLALMCELKKAVFFSSGWVSLACSKYDRVKIPP